MHLYNFLNEDENQTNITSIIEQKDWEKLLNYIEPVNKGSSIKGFNVNGDYIPFKNASGGVSEKFKTFAKLIRTVCGNNVEKHLTGYVKKLQNVKVKSFVQQTLLPALVDPESVANKNNQTHVPNPDYYRNIAIALVYRSSAFISKMADTKTEINPKIFGQLMIDAFNNSDGGNNKENFLLSFTNIDQKMSIDAAKKTVEQTRDNGDAEEQLGEESENENYYSELQNYLDFLFENDGNISIPRSIQDFSDKLPITLKQVDAVKHAWPKQYKYWYDKYETAFDEGLKSAQDDVRDMKKKELVDPLTKKKLPGRRTLGSGGPNAWLNDFKETHPTCGKWIDDIKNDKWTIFNMGPKLLFKIFDAIEQGGKFIQSFCDGIADGIKDIKKAFRSTNSIKDFEKQIDKYIEENDFGAGLAVAKASAVVQFSDLLNLLQNGPIGTVNLKNKTFTTAMSNSQTSIEVAVQNCLASLDKYTDTEKRFEENKDVKINSQQTDTIVSSEKTDNNKQPTNSANFENDDEEMDDNYKPTLKSFIISESDDESAGEKVSDDNHANDDESSTDISQEASENKMLSELEMIKQVFDDTIDKTRLKEVHDTLQSFKGDDGEVIRNSNDEKSNFTDLDKIIELYKLLANDDLKFNLDAASLKDFLTGIKNYLDDFKEIPKIENLGIKLSDKGQKLPAMDTTGELEVKITGEEKAKELADNIQKIQDKLINDHIAKLNSFAKECTNDDWLNSYENKIGTLNQYGTELRNIVTKTYTKTPKWFDEYFGQFKTKNYMTKLYMLMSCMTSMRNQLDSMGKDANKDDSEENEDISESLIKKPTTLLRSLYIQESDEQQVNDGNNNPTQPAHNQEKFREGGKQEAVAHSINELWNRIQKIDLNSALLSTKWNADEYVKNDPENFNALSRKFAQNSTGLQITHVDTGNGIASIIRHVLDTSHDYGKKNIELLKSKKCTKLASFFSGNGASENTKRNDSDLFILFAAAHGCAKALVNAESTEKDVDTKRLGKEQKEQQPNETKPKEDASYQYPNVSKDSFLNEIYKYIRG